MTTTAHWLDRYANNYHQWEEHGNEEARVFTRPIGLVENGFHYDGHFHGGRADFHVLLKIDVKNRGTIAEFRKRITLAWTVLRLQHTMLLVTADTVVQPGAKDLMLQIQVPRSSTGALKRGQDDLEFVENFVDSVQKFRKHSINATRLLNASRTLSRLYVFTRADEASDSSTVDCLFYVAHMLADGLTMYEWASAFLQLIKKETSHLMTALNDLVEGRAELSLPPPQEDVYLQVPGNVARQRWFWLLARIARHLRKPKGRAGFINPIRHKTRREVSLPFQAEFPNLLDYSDALKPPLESGITELSLTRSATKRLFELCRASNVSIGAGGFVLIGMAMMKLYEEEEPDLELEQRLPFIGSFPLNPRPFLNYTGPYDSCMLSFSDGIVVPYLPSNLDTDRRFGVLARAAHRELRSYQKKPREATDEVDAHSPLRLQANTYLMMQESVDRRLPRHMQKGVNVQGQYPAKVLWGRATCGVSSLGRIGHLFAEDAYPDSLSLGGEDALNANYKSLTVGVRARDNEFLVGVRTSWDDRLEMSVSYDATAMDDDKVRRWKELVQTMLEP